MARSQVNGSIILLGLEGYEVGEVIGEEKGIVVEVRIKLYQYGKAKKGRIFHVWSQGKRVHIAIARHRWR